MNDKNPSKAGFPIVCKIIISTHNRTHSRVTTHLIRRTNNRRLRSEMEPIQGNELYRCSFPQSVEYYIYQSTPDLLGTWILDNILIKEWSLECIYAGDVLIKCIVIYESCPFCNFHGNPRSTNYEETLNSLHYYYAIAIAIPSLVSPGNNNSLSVLIWTCRVGNVFPFSSTSIAIRELNLIILFCRLF